MTELRFGSAGVAREQAHSVGPSGLALMDISAWGDFPGKGQAHSAGLRAWW